MSNKLSDLDKSMELAEQINMMKIPILMIDVDYLLEMSEQFYKQASFEDSAAVLNPHYSPIKTALIKKQADALSYLHQYIQSLKEIDKLKSQVGEEQKNLENIMKLFL